MRIVKIKESFIKQLSDKVNFFSFLRSKAKYMNLTFDFHS